MPRTTGVARREPVWRRALRDWRALSLGVLVATGLSAIGVHALLAREPRPNEWTIDLAGIPGGASRVGDAIYVAVAVDGTNVRIASISRTERRLSWISADDGWTPILPNDDAPTPLLYRTGTGYLPGHPVPSRLARLDPATGDFTGEVTVALDEENAFPAHIRFIPSPDGLYVWGQRLHRVDPQTGTVDWSTTPARRLALDREPLLLPTRILCTCRPDGSTWGPVVDSCVFNRQDGRLLDVRARGPIDTAPIAGSTDFVALYADRVERVDEMLAVKWSTPVSGPLFVKVSSDFVVVVRESDALVLGIDGRTVRTISTQLGWGAVSRDQLVHWDEDSARVRIVDMASGDTRDAGRGRITFSDYALLGVAPLPQRTSPGIAGDADTIVYGDVASVTDTIPTRLAIVEALP